MESRLSWPRQRLGFHRHAEDGQRGHGGGHAGQVGGAACAGDDHLEALRLGVLGEGDEPVRGAVGGDDAGIVGDAERVEGLGGMAHGGPVGLAAHDDGNGGSRHGVLRHEALMSSGNSEAARGRQGRSPQKARLHAMMSGVS